MAVSHRTKKMNYIPPRGIWVWLFCYKRYRKLQTTSIYTIVALVVSLFKFYYSSMCGIYAERYSLVRGSIKCFKEAREQRSEDSNEGTKEWNQSHIYNSEITLLILCWKRCNQDYLVVKMGLLHFSNFKFRFKSEEIFQS